MKWFLGLVHDAIPPVLRWFRGIDPNLIIASAAVVGIVVALMQLRITRNQTRILDEQRKQTRAWVGVVDPQLQLTSPLGAKITIRNFGQTPALRMKSKVSLQVRSLDALLPESPPIQTTEPGSSITVLQPTQFVSAQDHAKGQNYVTDVNMGKVAVYFVGRIAYDDIFDESHQTTFAYVFIPLPNNKGTWKTLDTGNTTD